MSRLGVIPRYIIPDTPRYLLNGLPLKDYGLFAKTEGLQVGSVDPATSYRSVPGMYGDYDVTFTNLIGAAFLPRRDVTLTVGTVGAEEDFRTTQLQLGALIGREVSIRDQFQPGEWVGRLNVDAWDVERNDFGCFIQASTVLTVTALPYMVGDEHTTQLPATKLYVKANVPVYPTLKVTPTNGSTSPLVLQSKKSDETTYSRVLKLNPNKSWGDITLDVDMATGLVNEPDGTPYYNLDMSTDFWMLTPGLNDVNITGGVGTIAYKEAWTV